jgi:hypothetical protein
LIICHPLARIRVLTRVVSLLPGDSWRTRISNISSVFTSPPHPRQNPSVSAAIAAENLSISSQQGSMAAV